MNHSVPAALYCWLRWPDDFRAAVEAAVRLGGDTDTVGAITGELAGATVGADAIPADWIEGLLEYPRGIQWLRRLADTLAQTIEVGSPGQTVPLPWVALLPRNLVFLALVLLHGLRRLLPPY